MLRMPADLLREPPGHRCDLRIARCLSSRQVRTYAVVGRINCYLAVGCMLCLIDVRWKHVSVVRITSFASFSNETECECNANRLDGNGFISESVCVPFTHNVCANTCIMDGVTKSRSCAKFYLHVFVLLM